MALEPDGVEKHDGGISGRSQWRRSSAFVLCCSDPVDWLKILLNSARQALLSMLRTDLAAAICCY